MARPHRVDYEGARHHVMNRGARHDDVFLTDVDRNLFLLYLARLPDRFGIVVHAFALLPNHFHLLLETPRGNLSEGMKFVTSGFVRHLNQRYAWDGPVFKDRFRSRLILDDAHWLYLPAYIHLNSVRAGLVDTPIADCWNSHQYYAGAVPVPEWLTVDELLEAHGGRQRYSNYLRRVHGGHQQIPEGFDPDALWRSTPAENIRPRPPRRVGVLQALSEVQEVTGIPMRRYQERAYGPFGRARWIAAWWMDRRTGRPHRELATHLRACPEQVCRWIRRVEQERWTDEWLRPWTEELGRLLLRVHQGGEPKGSGESSFG